MTSGLLANPLHRPEWVGCAAPWVKVTLCFWSGRLELTAFRDESLAEAVREANSNGDWSARESGFLNRVASSILAGACRI